MGRLRRTASRRVQVLLVIQPRFAGAREILRGIAGYESHHYTWTGFLDDEARAEHDIDWLHNRRWDGVVNLHTTARFAEECRHLGIPLVDLNDRPAIPGVHNIRPDNAAIGRMGAEHFIVRGCWNFAFFGSSNQDWSAERCRGFVERVGLAGFSCGLHEASVELGGNSPDWEWSLMPRTAEWLARSPLPLAVMACHDLLGSHVIRACDQIGLRIPEEVAVLGVDNDVARCQLAHPPLSSVATNGYVSGYTAAALLDKLISGSKVEPVETRTAPVQTVVRRSSDIHVPVKRPGKVPSGAYRADNQASAWQRT